MVDSFRAIAEGVAELGMEVALALALQASPDHPWVTEHPEWFSVRADGSIAYAENPPKKYQDIYPFDFETADRSMRLASLHPGVSVEEVVESTGFELAIPDAVPETRPPSTEELRLIRDVLDAVAPHVLLLTETNVPHEENVSYFGAGDEAHS